MSKYILGIESSCDETAASVVRDGRFVLSDIIRSSAEIHKKYGGVVPEIASREHVNAIVPVIAEALDASGISCSDITAVAVTAGPGLVGSLLVGVSAAKALAFVWDKPLVPVHHLAGHIAANYLAYPELEPPFMALVVSGAHSHIVRVRTYTDYEILARTRDDAPGEAFDKIAREIGLGYPGGPKIDKLSPEGDASKLKLPRTHFEDSFDFSFSGLKTAVLNELNRANMEAHKKGAAREDILSNKDIAASFQENVCAVLIEHLEKLAEREKMDKVVLAGGVSANSLLRRKAEEMCRLHGFKLYIPPLKYCTDNAAMIASQGYFEYMHGNRAKATLNARAVWELGTNVENCVNDVHKNKD